MSADLKEGDSFDVSMPHPLDIAFRSAIFDVFGMKRGNILKTFWDMTYDWMEKHEKEFSPRTMEAWKKAKSLDLNKYI